MPQASNLKSMVKGWGADLELENRPAGKKEANRESVTDSSGDDYDKIPKQVPRVEILVSTEHKKLTPVFGTSCPPKGLSGVLRRWAFKYSEGQKAHWLILLFADRVDVAEGVLSDLVQGKSQNPFKEMGWAVEFRRGGFLSRFGHNRADVRRWRQEALIAATLIGAGVIIYKTRRRAA